MPFRRTFILFGRLLLILACTVGVRECNRLLERRKDDQQAHNEQIARDEQIAHDEEISHDEQVTHDAQVAYDKQRRTSEVDFRALCDFCESNALWNDLASDSPAPAVDRIKKGFIRWGQTRPLLFDDPRLVKDLLDRTTEEAKRRKLFAINAQVDGNISVSKLNELENHALLSGSGVGNICLGPPSYSGTFILIGSTVTTPNAGYYAGAVDLRVLQIIKGTLITTLTVSMCSSAPAVYTVSACMKSSSNIAILGTVSVTSGSVSIVTPGTSNSGLVYIPISSMRTGSEIFGGGRHPFPPDFDIFDVASISLSNSNHDVVATATLTPVSNGYLDRRSGDVKPGVLAPSATAGVAIHAVAGDIRYIRFRSYAAGYDANGIDPVYAHGYVDGFKPKFNREDWDYVRRNCLGHVRINAHGLPPNTNVILALDGTDFATVTTDDSGDLNADASQGEFQGLRGSMPENINLFIVRTLTVHDAGGKSFLTVKF